MRLLFIFMAIALAFGTHAQLRILWRIPLSKEQKIDSLRKKQIFFGDDNEWEYHVSASFRFPSNFNDTLYRSDIGILMVEGALRYNILRHKIFTFGPQFGGRFGIVYIVTIGGRLGFNLGINDHFRKGHVGLQIAGGYDFNRTAREIGVTYYYGPFGEAALLIKGKGDNSFRIAYSQIRMPMNGGLYVWQLTLGTTI